jgi:hypothetical protein
MARLPSQRPEERASALHELLDRLRQASSREDEAVERYALGRLEATYAESRDAFILDALDLTRLDGGFANDVCATYVRMLSHPEARARYSNRPAPVARCIGISYSEAELRDLLQARQGER